MTDAQQFIARRRTAYVKAFANTFGEEVLADLARFCRAGASTFDPDPRIHALLEGRREVYLRIMDHLHLTEDELLAKYAGQRKGKQND